MKNKKVLSLTEKRRNKAIANMVKVLTRKAIILRDQSLVWIGRTMHRIQASTIDAVKNFVRRQIELNPSSVGI